MNDGDIIVAKIKRLRERAMNDQTDFLGHHCDTLDLLQQAFCEHLWKRKDQETAICPRCGLEKPA